MGLAKLKLVEIKPLGLGERSVILRAGQVMVKSEKEKPNEEVYVALAIALSNPGI
jgi:hypothetical protein